MGDALDGGECRIDLERLSDVLGALCTTDVALILAAPQIPPGEAANEGTAKVSAAADTFQIRKVSWRTSATSTSR